MSEYTLQPSESFVLRNEEVLHGTGWSNYTNILILTTRHLVLVQRGIWGRAKGTIVLPLSQITVHQGRTQALPIDRVTDGRLDVHFAGGTETFGFQTPSDAQHWAEKINEVVTGTPATPEKPVPVTTGEKTAAALKSTVSAVKDAFGYRTKAEIAAQQAAEIAAAAAVPIAGSCLSCGAPISGPRGRALICGYCDSTTQL